MCNVSNVDDEVNRKVIEDKKASIEISCAEAAPIFRPSNIVVRQQKQNVDNGEVEFLNIFACFLFPSILLEKAKNIQLTSILLQSADNIQGFLRPPFKLPRRTLL